MPNGVRLGFVAEEIKVAVAGILLVSLVSIALNVLSWLFPASDWPFTFSCGPLFSSRSRW